MKDLIRTQCFVKFVGLSRIGLFRIDGTDFAKLLRKITQHRRIGRKHNLSRLNARYFLAQSQIQSISVCAIRNARIGSVSRDKSVGFDIASNNFDSDRDCLSIGFNDNFIGTRSCIVFCDDFPEVCSWHNGFLDGAFVLNLAIIDNAVRVLLNRIQNRSTHWSRAWNRILLLDLCRDGSLWHECSIRQNSGISVTGYAHGDWAARVGCSFRGRHDLVRPNTLVG